MIIVNYHRCVRRERWVRNKPFLSISKGCCKYIISNYLLLSGQIMLLIIHKSARYLSFYCFTGSVTRVWSMPLAIWDIERTRSSILHDIRVHFPKPLIKLVHPVTKLIKRLVRYAAHSRQQEVVRHVSCIPRPADNPTITFSENAYSLCAYFTLKKMARFMYVLSFKARFTIATHFII